MLFSVIPSTRLPKCQARPGTYHSLPVEGSNGAVARKARLADATQAATVPFARITLPRHL